MLDIKKKLQLLINNKITNYKYILQQIPELNQYLSSNNITTQEKIYWFLHDLSETNKCDICNAETTFDTISKGYRKYCSRKCMGLSNDVKQKRKETNLINFGVEFPAQSIEKKQKAIATSVERYGVLNPMQSEKIQRKYINSIQEKYGVDNISKATDIKIKKEETTIKNYGVKHNSQSAKIKEKKKDTCLKNYGVDNIFKHKETRIKSSILLSKTKFKTKINKLSKTNITPLFTWEEYTGSQDLTFSCNKCDNIFIYNPFRGAYVPICRKCNPRIISKPENELKSFIRSLNFTFNENDRQVIKPFELDLVIPSKKTAIELNGIFWHSELQGKDKNYHLLKTKKCINNDIKLIHIWDTEWINSQKIIKSRIKHILGLSRKIMARKCQIREITPNIANKFLKLTHLQGKINSKINIGLFYKNKLVAVMTFSKSRYTKNIEWELLRYATIRNYCITGGASKLLSYFEKTYLPKSLISYADKRWSNGSLYYQLGFNLSHESLPNFWYFKGNKLESRIKYQKHKLSSLLPIFDINKSEWENMKINGYNRIWDCGNMVFKKIY